MNGTTSRTRLHMRECVIPGAIALAVVVCLPLVGLVALAVRPVLIAGLLLVFALAAARCVMGGCVRSWFARLTAPEVEYRGMRLARDVAMDRGHCWAWVDGEVLIGADDVVTSVLGPVDEVGLPYVGRRVERGEPLFRLRHGDRTIDLSSPVSGTVVASNEALREHPDLVNEHPYGEGWVVRIRGDRLEEERGRLLLGRDALRWFRGEVDWLLRLLPPARAEGRVDERVDDASWGVLRRAFASGSHA